MADWTHDPDNFRKAIRVLSFEAYHMSLFLKLCQQGLDEYHRIKARGDGGKYPRSFCDQAFEYSFYIHLRVLVGFFYIKAAYEDDVVHSHFIPHLTQPFSPKPLDAGDVWAKTLRENLNKRVAHLSSRRFMEDQPQSTGHRKDELEYYLDYGEKVRLVTTSFVGSLTTQLQKAFNDRWTDEFEKCNVPLLKSGQLPKHFTIGSL